MRLLTNARLRDCGQSVDTAASKSTSKPRNGVGTTQGGEEDTEIVVTFSRGATFFPAPSVGPCKCMLQSELIVTRSGGPFKATVLVASVLPCSTFMSENHKFCFHRLD
jgi:hypothetical protein